VWGGKQPVWNSQTMLSATQSLSDSHAVNSCTTPQSRQRLLIQRENEIGHYA
jgi:hypothetical protein